MPKRKKKSQAEEAAELAAKFSAVKESWQEVGVALKSLGPASKKGRVWLIIIVGIVAYIVFVGSQPATVSPWDVYARFCAGTRVGMSAGTSMAKAAKHYEIPLLEAASLVEEYVADQGKEILKPCVSIRGQ